MGDAVPAALLAEATEVAQILPDLSGRHLKQLTELLRTYDIDAAVLKLGKGPQVAR
jgi:hypothetical protein